jgi:hypothetical protein
MRFINIYWKTLLHILLLALEDPIGITSYRRKYRHPLSKFNGFLCSFDLFYLSYQIISMCISEHFPKWLATIIACLLWSSLSYHPCRLKLWRGRDAAIAAGQKRRNGWLGRWGPTRSVPTAAFVAGMLGSGGIGVLSSSIKQRFPSHHHHQKLACSGWSAREAGLVARGSCSSPLRH